MSAPQLGKEASGVPRTDLSGMFGTPAAAAVPDRTAGVPKLTPPPRPAVPTPAADPPPPADPVPARTAPAAATAGRTRRASTSNRSKTRHPSSVVIYLPASLRTRLRSHAASTGRSHTQIVFDALNATHSRLADLTPRTHPPTEQITDGLFVAQASGRRVHDEDQVQVSIRPNPTNLAVIDSLAAQHTAGNRSALITVALDQYLHTA